MKLFILQGACKDDCYLMSLETPKVFKTREEALKALEARYKEEEDNLSEYMDSGLDLDLGVANFYLNDNGGGEPWEYLYEICEVEA